MTARFHTSPAPRAYRLSSGRRDWIHGPIRPLHDPVLSDALLRGVPVFILVAICAAFIVGA